MKNVLISVFLVSSLLSANDDAIRKAVASVKEKYCPDRRTAVFDVAWEAIAGTVIVRGEVDNAKAKEELIGAIARTGTVVDSIRVLPDPMLGSKTYGIVVVSVGNVRSKPGESEELATQVLMGTAVKVLKRASGYYYVQSPDLYLGWLDDDALQLTDEAGRNAWATAAKVMVTCHFTIVREEPREESLPVCDAVAGNVFRTAGTSSAAGWTDVMLADGRRGFVTTSAVENYEAWKSSRQLTGENVEKTAKMFIGVPYLWGGTSPKGMDCSGFTKTVFRMNGMELNRDASQQVLMGTDVPLDPEFKNLKKGDLLFFGRKASADRPERITHVAMYLENKGFIHSSGRVKLGSFDSASPLYDAGNLRRLVRARRVIPQPSAPEVK